MNVNQYEYKVPICKFLNIIEQQRVDLKKSCCDWHIKTEKYDRYWISLVSMRPYLTVIGSALAIWTVRSPSRIIRWIKRVFSLWSTWRVIRSAI
ncbi:YqjK-like family protein [Candidatus Pantoea carbekii]|uniref:Uncharacterized protein n=1 Tax=Candidatus Pantoea carbekii TaxID=1235990 RepID=U3U2C5_9GAMM|nr:YqjK-like family protein [Candidatus Pantoea carbekii]AKC32538.1 inner membrane protein YqjK [Candidatus Pantoea carbekii]BAO00266.1 hypothetical protein HHS_02960 [Candidatus Pantoea carbekii]